MFKWKLAKMYDVHVNTLANWINRAIEAGQFAFTKQEYKRYHKIPPAILSQIYTVIGEP